MLNHKEQQQKDLDTVSQTRNILTEKAEQLAEKYEDAAERQQNITDRQVLSHRGGLDSVTGIRGSCTTMTMTRSCLHKAVPA